MFLKLSSITRQPLGLNGEAVLRIPPLGVPSDSPAVTSPVDIEEFLSKFPAIRLFAERVQAVEPSFAVSARNVATIVQLCAELDGIPLALELAAARVKALSIDQVLERMSDRFGLLSQGVPGALPHQETLHNAMEWSHDLLTEPERALFCRLSVFSDGCSLEPPKRYVRTRPTARPIRVASDTSLTDPLCSTS